MRFTIFSISSREADLLDTAFFSTPKKSSVALAANTMESFVFELTLPPKFLKTFTALGQISKFLEVNQAIEE